MQEASEGNLDTNVRVRSRDEVGRLAKVFNGMMYQLKDKTSELEQLNRILCQHKWRSLQDWVTTLDELADLSDYEIDEIQQMRVASCDDDLEE